MAASGAILHFLSHRSDDELLGFGIAAAIEAGYVAFIAQIAERGAFSEAQLAGAAGIAVNAFAGAQTIGAENFSVLFQFRAYDVYGHVMLRCRFIDGSLRLFNDRAAVGTFVKNSDIYFYFFILGKIFFFDSGFYNLLGTFINAHPVKVDVGICFPGVIIQEIGADDNVICVNIECQLGVYRNINHCGTLPEDCLHVDLA